MHRPPLDQFLRGAGREPDMLFGAEQDDIGQRRLDGVANAARAVGFIVSGRAGVRLDSGAAQVAQVARIDRQIAGEGRSEEHTSELQSLMRISYAVFCLKKKKKTE